MRNARRETRDARRETRDEDSRNYGVLASRFSLLGSRSLVFILLLALLLRLALWVQPLHQLANDEIEYVTVARDLLAGRGWQFYEHYHWLRAPLYPLFLAASLWLARGDLHLAALPNIALSVATVGLSYALTRELARNVLRSTAPQRAALLTAVLFTLATFASLYMAETLFTALFTAAFWLLLCWDRGKRDWHILACSGVLLGLATLTRSITLAFVPLVALWIATCGSEKRGARSETRTKMLGTLVYLFPNLVGALIFALCFFLPIAPWTLHNCAAYGRCILVETGLSYNLWAFNEPRESEETIFGTLETIPNPALRADYATSKGLARLREDPAILVRKLWPNWNYLWRVNPIIEDRFILPIYYADPPPLVFLAALLLDDALYVFVLVMGVIGLAQIQRSRAQILCAAWLAYVIAVTLVTHAEGRYRHFLFPLLIPCAAIAIGRWSENRRQQIRDKSQETRDRYYVSRIAAAAFVVLLLYSVVTTYPWEWAGGSARRSALEMVGDLAWRWGDLVTAQRAYQQARLAQATPDAWLRLGDARRAAGNSKEALAAYTEADLLAPSYPATGVRRGDLLRELGQSNDARRAFQVPYTSPQAVLDWAWTSLHPAPTTRLDVGDGLDFGYLIGVYAAEEQQGAAARWSNGGAQVRLAIPRAQPIRLRLRLAAPRADDGVVTAQVCVMRKCTTLTISPTWRTYTVVLPPTNDPDALVEVRSDTFVADDGRQLGVLIDRVEVE